MLSFLHMESKEMAGTLPERCDVRAGKSKFAWCIMPDSVEGMSVS